MPTIIVNTTSTSFSLLPADLSQYSNWLKQYIPTGVTIFQDQSNAASGILALVNQVDAYLSAYGYSSASFVNTNELQVIAGSYIIDYYGTFSGANSDVTKIFLYNSANNTSGLEFW